MAEAIWQTDGNTVRLELAPLSGRLDMQCLAAGIVGFSIARCAVEDSPRAAKLAAEGGVSVPRAGLLGLELLGETGPPPVPAEWYVRQQDLVAWFSVGADRPLEVQAIWRGVPGGEKEGFAAAVDLIVGVRTQCPEADPGLSVASRLPAREVLPVGLAEGAAAGPWAWARQGPIRAAYLFRLGGGWSYAEMVHPATRLESRWASPHPCTAEVRHRLFAQPAEKLEKGVMLRAWIRGAWVPEEDDLRRASAIYAALAACEPPLDA